MLHNLRQKSEYQKRKIAVIASVLITGFIFIVWFSTTVHSFLALGTEPVDGTSEVSSAVASPFSLVKENVATVYESISQNAAQVRDQVFGQ